MRKLSIIIVIIISFAIPQTASAQTDPAVIAAFIRDGDLWVMEGDTERQITKGKKIASPRWSFDGNWLAYLEGNQDKQNVWLYNIDSGKKKLIFKSDTSNLQWASNKDVLAFQAGEILYVKDARKSKKAAKRIATEVGNYSWLPNGNGFLTSTISDLTPDGWTDIEFHKILLKNNKVKKSTFFELPALTIGNEDFGIGTSMFKWSPDNKWISFIKYPTASLSADANLLYVLSSDAKQLIKLDEMLNEPSWFKWAPNRNSLAYIGGINRMSIMNKFLTVKELPALSPGTLTPEGYVDRDFTWHNNHLITVARSKESEWSNDPAERPLPALYQIDLEGKKQKRITNPKKGFGDFNPNYLSESDRLVWVRTDREKSDVWIAARNGKNAKVWIKNIDLGDNYYEKWNWSNVLSVYDPEK
ncbi:translocation protein TolB [Alkalihalobacillus sp. AL-G]|uniref:translocation protein TolB n=1 Tax=Alkalihalobacillus sp. AL-G TaxID=2926399 RepID=UPI00272CA1CB|nr:translocation protein TolB [Alkalihalobacillus sp. AL-G]WLD92010.1 translocation protein TolB [Alkalihalobacillus sp. AL-G]